MAVITLDQATSYATAAGFTGDGLRVILAIAQAESGLDTTARNTTNNTPPSTDRGILQINSYWHSEVTDAEADDPAWAFRWAYPETKQGTDFHEWATYTTGAYLKFMANIPSGDTGVRLVPGIQTFCEWVVSLAGKIATCVEASEMVVDHIATRGRIPVSAAEDTALAEDLINRGQADPDGATNSGAASAQMTRLGIANTHFTAAGSTYDWVGTIKGAINRGVAVVYGFNQAHLTFDDWTHSATNAGVFGHAVAIVGYDATGAIVADPNTQQAANGNFVHYSWDCLLAAASGNPDIISPEVSVMLQISDVSAYFTEVDATHWKCIQNGNVIALGLLDDFRSLPFADTGLPLTNEFYPMGGAAGVAAQVFQRVIRIFDPARKFDNPPGALGACYSGHIDDVRLFHPASAVESDDEAAEATAVSDLQAALKASQDALAAEQAKPKVTPDIVSALTSAAQVLAPIGQAADEVVAALKGVQS